MGCRKNVKDLSPSDKSAFVAAILGVHGKPSVLHAGDPNRNRYDDFVEIHMNAMMAQKKFPDDPTFSPGWAHYAPAFYPWHRVLLYEFELELQSIIPTVTIPYWDWTDPASNPFTPDFLGGAGTGANGKVMPGDGPFAHDGPNAWLLHVVDNVGDPDYLQRYLNGADPLNGFPNTLPTKAGDVDPVINGSTVYEASPWKGSPTIDNCFRSRMEANLHNWIHNWVGGSMLNMTSPNDPVFWLHHCNIDRLWPVWMAQHPMAARYAPPAGTLGVAPGHGINDTMIFFSGGPAPWTGTFTPAAVVDHHALGYWYDADAARVMLLTPSVSFVNVQQGVGGTNITTYRPIKFDCESCGDVTLDITVAPSAGFGAPVLSETVHPNHDPTAGLSPSQGALWISYTSGAPGSSITGSVTVRATDVNSGSVFGPWTVTLSANTVPRVAPAVALVLDRSGSMTTDAGNGHQRVELLRTAVSTFIDLMQQGDGLSIVRFDNLVDTLMPVTDVGGMGGAGRLQAQDIVISHDPAKTLDPRGSTCIGGGIVAGKTALDAASATYSKRAMIVLTDGLENTHPLISEVSSSLNDHTFAIGFGQAAAISSAALNQITQNHGGYLVVTGPIVPEESFALTEYFLKIQAGISNSTAVLDPRGELIFGVTHRIPFKLTKADHGVDIVLVSPAPYYIDFRLEAPDGTIIDPVVAHHEPAISFVGTPRVSYYRASLPMLANDPLSSHAGQWHVLLRLGDRAKEGDRQLIASLGRPALPYALLVHAYSDLAFRPRLTQSSFEPGAIVQLGVALDQYEIPLDTAASAWAEITMPDGTRTVQMLASRGPGRFSASFTAADIGVYTARLRTRGVTFEGEQFEREQRLTATVFLGGDQLPPTKPNDWFCKLLGCLLGGMSMGPKFERELLTRGINLQSLLKCLEKDCHESDVILGGEQPFTAQAATREPAVALSMQEVRNVIFEIAHAAAGGTSHFAELIQGEPVPRLEPDATALEETRKFRENPFGVPPAEKKGHGRHPKSS